jgi:transposase InsO family protein
LGLRQQKLTRLPRELRLIVAPASARWGAKANRDRGRPRGLPLPHRRAYGSVHGGSIGDNDGAYGHVFTRRVMAMGIRDRPISPGSPWQNSYAERLIGTVRRECLDRMLIFGEPHLRQVLSLYAAYYNQMRTHLALGKDAPLGRAVERSGVIVAIPISSGLHHQYVRI